MDEYILTWIEAFLIDRKARGCAKGTIEFYGFKLTLFTDYCETQLVKDISQITPHFIRQYMLYLEEQGHNPGGRHAAFRALRAFLLWFEDEVDPEDWKNPIKKVKAPRVPTEPLEPVSLDAVSQLLKHCKANTFTGDRDKAILLFLLDTGVRAGELLSLNISDVNQATGEVLVRQGKGNKPRYVYIGKHTKRALRKYLKNRKDNYPALWVTHPYVESGRLTYSGLRSMIKRRANQADVDTPALHDFRRAFALNFLRNGGDIYSLQNLMGHADLQVLRRYLAQTTDDLQVAHRNFSPVDNSGL